MECSPTGDWLFAASSSYWVSSISALYSRGYGFKSRPRNRLQWVFSLVSWGPVRQVPLSPESQPTFRKNMPLPSSSLKSIPNNGPSWRPQLGLILSLKDGWYILLRNVGWLWMGYRVLDPRRYRRGNPKHARVYEIYDLLWDRSEHIETCHMWEVQVFGEAVASVMVNQ